MAKYNFKKINIPIFSSDLYIFQGKQKTIKKIDKDFSINWELGNMDDYSAFAWKFPPDSKYYGYGVFFGEKFSSKEAFHKEIAHECCHIKNYIFSDRLIDLDLINDETECYLLGWLVKKCVKFLKYRKK